jgi:protein SCO1/2
MHMTSRHVALSAALTSTWLALAAPVLADTPGDTPDASLASSKLSITTRDYTVPAVRLVRDDGRSVSLPEEMNDGRPVVLNFIFTSCSSVCPLMSQVFGQFQQKLGSERDRVHLMSISIDPEEDTPGRLKEYARKFHAGPEWQHYTGTVEASLAAQKAFGVYWGDKMSHAVVTLLRAAPGQPWRRIDGFMTPDELLSEYHQLMRNPHGSVASR